MREDIACPSCGNTDTILVRRKYFVTSLRECNNCGLRFRCPKGDPEAAHRFYVSEAYKQQGLTTDIPSSDTLKKLLNTGFAGSEKDFSSRIEDLRRSGVSSGAKILDFGSSWGYGSWQLRRAGFQVYSYEIGKQRAKYAKEMLGCDLIEDLRTLAGTVDCFFTSHVIEHLSNPNLMFEAAKEVLAPGGLLVCYCPNGASERETGGGTQIYDKNWGAVHPLMITPSYMNWASKRHGFEVPTFGSDKSTLSGMELVTVARKTL
jgi:2-polyprenyl-3-methyl-5-hydroxy-6-metoxy-1,4-benzoquinol methylase